VLDVVGDGREAGVDVAAVPLQLALYEILDVSAVGRLDPAPPREHIGEAFLLAGGPEQARLDAFAFLLGSRRKLPATVKLLSGPWQILASSDEPPWRAPHETSNLVRLQNVRR
jgi:hypothetical protein